MDEALHLTDVKFLVTTIAVLFGMLQASLLYTGRGIINRLDRMDGSLKEHETRMANNERSLERHAILFEEHAKSCLKLTDCVDRLSVRVDDINVRCIANLRSELKIKDQ